MGHLCEALKKLGFATWNLEYRSIGDPGGAWPGTFDDVLAGAAFLKNIAKPYNLDLNRTIALGHSAGGQLALYLASRMKLQGVIGIGAVADLKRAQEKELGNRVVDMLHAPPSADPMQSLPLHTPQRLFCGKDDDIVPIEISRRYVEAARKKGDDARLIELVGASSSGSRISAGQQRAPLKAGAERRETDRLARGRPPFLGRDQHRS
jgi:acetyl esterase/lipase